MSLSKEYFAAAGGEILFTPPQIRRPNIISQGNNLLKRCRFQINISPLKEVKHLFWSSVKSLFFALRAKLYFAAEGGKRRLFTQSQTNIGKQQTCNQRIRMAIKLAGDKPVVTGLENAVL